MTLTFKLKKAGRVPFSVIKAYSGQVPVKQQKLVDVHYIPEEYRQFYMERLDCPTTDAGGDDDDN